LDDFSGSAQESDERQAGVDFPNATPVR